jgi:hypothetical protein
MARPASADAPARRLGLGRRVFVAALVVLGAAAAIALAWAGWEFYAMNGWERAERPDLAHLRSSGSAGLAYGIGGTALILVNLAYLLRRHVRALRRAGSLRTWMELHVLTGLVGSLLILFHSAFDLRTWLATGALIALAVLVVTGLVGRYIYAQVPRTVSGAEAGPAALQARADQAEAALARLLGPASPDMDRIRALAAQEHPVPGSRLACLLMLPVFSLRTFRTRLETAALARSIGRSLDASGQTEHEELLGEIEDVVLIRQRLSTLETFRELLRWWRGLHRAFAIVMVSAAIVHVVVVTALGYGF